MKRALIGLVLVAVAGSACTVHVADRDTSGQALVADTRAAECERRATTATSLDAAVATPLPSGTPWTEANEWALATSGSKAQVERDLRQRHYADCLGR